MTGILIDADISLYRAASAAEVEINWGGGLWTLHSEESQALRMFNGMVGDIIEKLGATEVVLCFSDPDRNFRTELSPTYKAHRKDTRKPLAYHALRMQIMEKAKSVIKPGLEADDVMGIISTRAPGRYIIASADKDLKTIPGKLYREGRVREISEEQADNWHIYQTLVGDVTDGYPGCPGVGPVQAEEIIRSPRRLRAEAHTLLRGKRKGEQETRYVEGEPCSLWQAAVDRFVAAGLTEADALLQARLARILRASDWDFDKSEVKLWRPTT